MEEYMKYVEEWFRLVSFFLARLFLILFVGTMS